MTAITNPLTHPNTNPITKLDSFPPPLAVYMDKRGVSGMLCNDRALNVTPDFVLSPAPTLTPPLKWAGGKRWLVPLLRDIWREAADDSTRLVEPFVGGMSVSLGLLPKRALLSDVNAHLINFYRHLAMPEEISMDIDKHSEAEYYAFRAEFNKLIASEEGKNSRRAAQLFYFLNRTCFNGVCRFNRKGLFNVSYGHRKDYSKKFSPSGCHELLRGWEIVCGSFDELSLQPTDFIYADPPYDDGWTNYSGEDFSWDSQESLARMLSQHAGVVVASNHYTDRIVELYASLGFSVFKVMAPRRISCKGDRTPKAEAVFTKNIDHAVVASMVDSFNKSSTKVCQTVKRTVAPNAKTSQPTLNLFA